jgi:hypothetical protein
MVDMVWRALYYPYADFRDPSFALRAALFYDELYFLQPGFFKAPRYVSNVQEINDEMWFEMGNELKPLYERKILRDVDSGLLGIRRYWMPGYESQVVDLENRAILISNIRRDIEDKKLQLFSSKSQKLAWSFPNMQFIGIAAAGLLFDVSENVEWNFGLEYVTDSPHTAHLPYTNVATIVHPKNVEKRISRSRWANESILVPFHVGEALMINVALLAATRLSATPLTDNLLHQQFLHQKIDSFLSQPDLHDWLAEHDFAKQARTSFLASEAIRIALPCVERLTAEKVIKIRSKCSDELHRFRIEMAKLAAEMEALPWHEKFDDEVSRIVDAQIQPAIVELENELKKLQRELGIRIVEKTIGAAPLSLATSLFMGLPIEIALAAGVGAGTLLQLLDYWHQKKSVKSNGIAYLLSLSR